MHQIPIFLRRSSEAARLLVLRIRFPQQTWLLVFSECVCFQTEFSVTDRPLFQRRSTECACVCVVCVCVCVCMCVVCVGVWYVCLCVCGVCGCVVCVCVCVCGVCLGVCVSLGEQMQG